MIKVFRSHETVPVLAGRGLLVACHHVRKPMSATRLGPSRKPRRNGLVSFVVAFVNVREPFSADHIEQTARATNPRDLLRTQGADLQSVLGERFGYSRLLRCQDRARKHRLGALRGL